MSHFVPETASEERARKKREPKIWTVLCGTCVKPISAPATGLKDAFEAHQERFHR